MQEDIMDSCIVLCLRHSVCNQTSICMGRHTPMHELWQALRSFFQQPMNFAEMFIPTVFLSHVDLE